MAQTRGKNIALLVCTAKHIITDKSPRVNQCARPEMSAAGVIVLDCFTKTAGK